MWVQNSHIWLLESPRLLWISSFGSVVARASTCERRDPPAGLGPVGEPCVASAADGTTSVPQHRAAQPPRSRSRRSTRCWRGLNLRAMTIPDLACAATSCDRSGTPWRAPRGSPRGEEEPSRENLRDACATIGSDGGAPRLRNW